jgi:putative mRNA 3-end processing factor
LRNIRLTKNGIECTNSTSTVYLDPKKIQNEGVHFVSHAHIDHLPNGGGGTILSSTETNKIAELRGFTLKNSVSTLEHFTLVDSGHIFGSKGLLFDDIFYTGDISTRDRGFLNGAKIPKCKTLITECTFGLPEFVLPPVIEIVKQVNEIIANLYSKGKPVLLLGYELGKAQTLSQLFSDWDPIYYHDSVKRMNDLHRSMGVPLKNSLGHTEAESKGLLDKKPWVMVAPMMSTKNNFIKHMKSKYGAITIGFSGWANSKKFGFTRGADYSMPLSDHCDYDELIHLVKQSEAEKIYTIHGFVNEFAMDLNKLGFSAQPLREISLDNFC